MYELPSFKTTPNEKQVGGTHYQGHDVQHWDYAYARGFDCFQYIITKWVERWRNKGGLEDLRKARHALDKYIALVELEQEDQMDGQGAVDLPKDPDFIVDCHHPVVSEMLFGMGQCNDCGKVMSVPTKEYVDQ